MKPKLTLPPSGAVGEAQTLDCPNNVIIVGANGSGKSKLGTRIESNNPNLVHRISAQRALNIPEFSEMKTLDQATRGLLEGNYNNQGNKNAYRWNNEPETHLLQDYDKILATLFALKTKRDSDFIKATRLGEAGAIPDSPIDIIERAWSDIMPHRELKFDDGKVLASKAGEDPYHGKTMSDGERVALYLLGQCLCVPDNKIIIVDEPEIHLHKSLMVRLWNKIEELCPNKLIVFITHDLDFAAQMQGAKKIWVKDFTPGRWTWEEIPEIDGLPEALALEIIGNRKNILFTEGERGSYDIAIYQAVYSGLHIIPRGNCENVIESTRATRGTPALNHLQAYGIIDSDYRSVDEIRALQDAGIYTIKVAEIENLFCIEPLLRIVAIHLVLDPDTVVRETTSFIFNALREELDLQATNHAEKEIQFRLGAYTKQGNNQQGLIDGFTVLTGSIDVTAIYTSSHGLYQNALDSANLNEVLKVYNRKSLSRRISQIFGLANGEYPQIILRLLKSNKKTEIIDSLRMFLPVIP